MATNHVSPSPLSDPELLSELARLADCERRVTADLIAALAEVDARRLYLGEGCSSLFTYCTRVLHMSEHAAYGRIEAARAARRFPAILDLLADGALTLTSVTLLAAHLTPENCAETLEAARHKSKREVEVIAARLRPRLPVAPLIRKLPSPMPHQPPDDTPVRPIEPLAPVGSRTIPAVVRPLAPERYSVRLTVTRDTHDKLRRAQDLLRHAVPNGDLAIVIDRAVTLLLSQLERRKCAASIRPRGSRTAAPGSRHIPAAVRREVWARDDGRCAFAGARGRCAERGFLEFHHVVPFADGGEATAQNVELRCRAHNAYEAEQHFGPTQPWLVRESAGSAYRCDSTRLSVGLGPDRAPAQGW